jgi:hypothetical protein
MSIGIPYAHATFDDDGAPAVVCPACVTMIREHVDRYGETIGNPYGEHWLAAGHTEADVTKASAGLARLMAERGLES